MSCPALVLLSLFSGVGTCQVMDGLLLSWQNIAFAGSLEHESGMHGDHSADRVVRDVTTEGVQYVSFELWIALQRDRLRDKSPWESRCDATEGCQEERLSPQP